MLVGALRKPIGALASIGLRCAFLLVVIAGCGGSGDGAPAPSPGQAVTVRFEGAPVLRVEVARTAAERQRGLMHRTAVPDQTGMIFVFDRPTRVGFWMKDTLVPLSIAYVRGGRVVSTAEMTPCPPPGASCPTYPPAGEYDTAVEAPAGFFRSWQVRPGTRIAVQGLR